MISLERHEPQIDWKPQLIFVNPVQLSVSKRMSRSHLFLDKHGQLFELVNQILPLCIRKERLHVESAMVRFY
ncbi:uncharacterized protein PHALS_02858 [Plasmopara halstedii]|uniref:Uncharacterized protein n=1 Tax=Plasmopara halstedii TaxID=4781 RepID=A0A0P1AVL0_PLAHL|nr:uncharacterized protein PHALS_02858 [Plasmopara halstedii]CEG46457.1 hypothetical protein PHALS_02858 [Plasmopara halstedii]|eukprot:XP_024582826.1 hypothetical protein PHALS_02858 [Plasmopara halstedii]